MRKTITIQILIIAICILALVECGKTPKNVEELSNKIRVVSYFSTGESTIAKIELDGVFGYNEAVYFFRASQEMSKILKKMAVYFPHDQEQVLFVLKAQFENQSGKPGEKVVLEIPFSMSEVKKVKFYQSSSWDFLNISDQIKYTHPVGRNIIRSFCNEEKNGKYARHFCLSSL